MEHVVFYPGPEGKPAFGRFSSMDEAVAYVERLRNVEGIVEASLFAMTPVQMVVRTVYKVEVPADVAAPAVVDVAAPVEVAPAVPDAPVAEVEAPVVEEPVVDAPVAEADVVDGPVAEADVVDGPVAEVPAQVEPMAEPMAEPMPEPVADEADAVHEDELPVLVGTADIAPSHNGRRTLGFFSH